jgi:hypothetical protein
MRRPDIAAGAGRRPRLPGGLPAIGRLVLAMALVVLVGTAAEARNTVRAPQATGFHPRQLTIAATVASVDGANRAVTLNGPKGAGVVLVVARSVGNFEQLKPGDKVRIVYLEALAIALRDADGAAGPSAAEAVPVVLPGKKPTTIAVDTVEVGAAAAAVDRANRTVTLALPDGRRATVRVDPAVKAYAGLKPGAQIVVRLTQATAISIR